MTHDSFKRKTGHCKDCRYWKASQVIEYSTGRYPIPKTVVCRHTKKTVGRMDTCSYWELTPVEPTCYNCIHLNHDEGRAHLYGYGFCSLKQKDGWVNVETKRKTCKYHTFRESNHEI